MAEKTCKSPNKFIRELVIWADVAFMLCACFLVLALLRDRVNSLHGEWKKAVWADEDLMERPSRIGQLPALNIAATGIKPLVADIYWTKAMTMKSDRVVEMMKAKAQGAKVSTVMAQSVISRTTADSRDLYDLIRMVTALDPDFEYAYYYGTTLLEWDNQVPLALSLAESGFRANPKSAMLASSLSFIYYYFLNDWDKGAYYAEISFRNTGKYSATPRMVSDMYAAGRNYEMAIRFLTDSLSTIKDERTKKEVENQIAFLIVEYHIQQLEKAAGQFKDTFGWLPQHLDELVLVQVMKTLPKEPFGGKYVIKKDGTITNEPEMRNSHYQQMRDFVKYKPREGRSHL